MTVSVSDSLATLEDLTYSYPAGENAALDAVSVRLEAGLTGVVGKSGSGKSTLLRVLNGLVPHFHGGRVRGGARVGAENVLTSTTAQLARHVGFVFQDPETQFVRAGVEDEVAFALENTAMPRAAMLTRVDEALDAAGIPHLRGRPLARLSGGERQRVAIASALALRPAILALDEPTSQLDAAGTRLVLDACRRLAAAGTAVVLAEHRAAPLLPLANQLAVTLEGRVAGPGPVRDMLNALEDPPPLVELAERLGWRPAPLTVEDARPMAPALARPAPPVGHRGGEVAWETTSAVLGQRRQPVLHDVHLAGAAGEVVVLMGPNGGGKTTLLRAIAGLQRPLAGAATRRPGRVAYLPQDPGVLLNRQTVRAEVAYTLRRAGSADAPERILRALGLEHLAHRYPGDLSSGQRQRAASAAILAGAPSIALLDEPTRGMDGDARRRLTTVVRELAGGGTAVVLATHDSDLAAEVADRLVLVDGGHVRDTGEPRAALSGAGAYATDIGRLYPGGPVTVEELLACL